MTIKIYLENNNNATAQVKIYRDTKEIVSEALPEPIATLPGDAKVFEETDYLFYDTDYHYRVMVISESGDEILSKDKIFRLGHDLGPGPKELIAGDENFGLFGVLDSNTDGFEVLTVFNKIQGNNVVIAGQYGNIIKYIRKGKVYYIKGYPNSTSYNWLYINKFVTGGTANPYISTPASIPEMQGQPEINLGGRRYALRLPTFIEDSHTDLTYTDASKYNVTTTEAGYSEAIDLYRVFVNHGFILPADKMPFRFSVLDDHSTYIPCSDSPIANQHIRFYFDRNTKALSANAIGKTDGSSYKFMNIAEYIGYDKS